MWNLSEAKNKFSEVFELALHKGPQVITRRGKESGAPFAAWVPRASTSVSL